MRIDKDVPMPSVRQEYNTFPFDRMEIGDSFHVMDADRSLTSRIQSQISYMKHHAEDNRRFASRRDGEGVRVWRVQDAKSKPLG